MRTDRPFTYVIDSAKADSPGHDKSTGFVQAWIKYSKPPPVRGGLNGDDYDNMVALLNPDFMKMFNYKHPPATTEEAKAEEQGDHEEADHEAGGEYEA